ncbi:MAG: thiamine pyrophosphate-binding protein [Planctomycetes bacterium]|nr:thiamine pyrophosphate-binding protein [Planctomycetota bacterium]
MKGSSAEIIVKYLEQEGVEYVFGVPGGHLLPFYDALYKNGTIKAILTKHEAGAALMAYGYAVTSGKIGVCCGTVGPGATNLVTGVASAYVDSVPLLVLTAQVGTTAIGKGALQEAAGVGRTVDQVALFEKITKMNIMEIRAKNMADTIRRALRVAFSGRPGPVHIDLPADVQAEVVEADLLPVSAYRTSRGGSVNVAHVKTAFELLKNAAKPAILAGYGAAASRQGENLLRLAEGLAIPVTTTLRAKGVFPEDHPLSLGCVGLYGTRAANSYLRSDIDVLLSVGASFHEFTTHCWDPAFAPSKALIQIDIDPTEIGKNYPVTLGLVGDAEVVLKSLVTELSGSGRKGHEIGSFKNNHEYFREDSMLSDAIPMKPQRLMKELREVLPRDVIVFADIGNTLTWAERCFQAYSEGHFVAASGLAAMGSAVAACIGGKLGRPQSPTLCLCGDGDFHMTGMEVATAAAHKIPVVWIVLKNSRLGMIHDLQSVSYQSRYISSTFSDTDFVLAARALGAEGYRTDNPSEIGPIVKETLMKSTPAVIEATIDAAEMPPMKPRMLALKRSLGLPDATASFSWNAIKALWTMVKER